MPCILLVAPWSPLLLLLLPALLSVILHTTFKVGLALAVHILQCKRQQQPAMARGGQQGTRGAQRTRTWSHTSQHTLSSTQQHRVVHDSCSDD